MLDAMREVTRPDELDRDRVSSVRHIAWKTGTSYGARDGWAVGITPRHVVGVWVGNADGSGAADLTGARTAGPVMFDLFDLLPFCGWFAEPQKLDGTRSELICKATHSDPAAELFWHLDRHFIGSTTDLHRISLPLSPGVHRITVVDQTGAQMSREVIIQ